MNGSNFSGLALAADAQPPGPHSASLETLYKQYRPPVRELLPLPRPLVYVLMASMVVVGVAYAIVGHLIKDLAIDIADCLLGPVNDEDENKDNLQHVALGHHPPAHPFAHNAFHVWDQDEVMVPLPQEESPLSSPLLLAASHYIPTFFPVTHSPTSHNSAPHFSSSSPGATKDMVFSREV